MNRATVFLAFVSWVLPAVAETVKDREGAVRADAAAMRENERWIYNDLYAAFDEAARSGRPLMIVLRCVPCLACMGLDAEVLTEGETLKPLLDQFVRVRLINANALDLSLFQFDYDLSFSVIFLNADRTIYGRFGSWEHQKDSQNRATEGLRQALEGVLKLHADYPGTRTSLAGKTGPHLAFRTPTDLPSLKQYRPELDWSGQVVKSCVHCHQIGDALRLDARDEGRTLRLAEIFPHPAPETVGILCAETPATGVAEVLPGSAAEKAGLRAGDEILALQGQPLVSVADLSWVLHQCPDEGDLPMRVRRGAAEIDLTLHLSENWRRGADISRRVGVWPMRAMAFGGMKLRGLDATERGDWKIADGKLALLAEHVGEYGPHAAAKRAGFRKGDLIVSIAGSDEEKNETALLADLLLAKKPGEQVPVEILRNGERLALFLPIQ